jgi:uncharacterized membrane protein YciS (DUF1049 family)
MAGILLIMLCMILFYIVINLRLDNIEKKIDDINKKLE